MADISTDELFGFKTYYAKRLRGPQSYYWHAVLPKSGRALCGVAPYGNSAWSPGLGEGITCTRCLSMLAREFSDERATA